MKRYAPGLLVAFLLSGGCQDPFLPPVDKEANALVVEALLTDVPQKLSVRLSRTSSFLGKDYGLPENNAGIALHTLEGDCYSFRFLGNGFYESKQIVAVQPNTTCILTISTENGESYASDYEIMPRPVSLYPLEMIDTVYTQIYYDDEGNGHPQDYPGILFRIRPHVPEQEGSGFIYDWKVLTNYNIETNGLAKKNYFCWEFIHSQEINIYPYSHSGRDNRMLPSDLVFLSYYSLSPLPIDSSRFQGGIGSLFTESFYFHVTQYSMNQKASRFWTGLKKQSEATGKLFDPVEEQLVSNILCTSDSTKKAYGYFTVASVSNLTYTVKIGTETLFRIQEAYNFPEGWTVEDCLVEELPWFWIW
ncbi:MAG TPA: DUF4249 domain-containing protein [Prolixibacteraceae bacterium]|nr:DUF4249 domain-containing protein [Prolixibacteraceae bacterium]